MPNSTRFLPRYRKNTSGGRYYGYVAFNGKRHHLPGPCGSTTSIAACDRIVAELLANNRRLPIEETCQITVTELADQYFEFCKSYYVKDGKPTSEIERTRTSLRMLRHLYGNCVANDFGPKKLKAVRQLMIDKNWTRNEVNKQSRRIKAAFRLGVAEELIDPTVIHALDSLANLKKGRSPAREFIPVGENLRAAESRYRQTKAIVEIGPWCIESADKIILHCRKVIGAFMLSIKHTLNSRAFERRIHKASWADYIEKNKSMLPKLEMKMIELQAKFDSEMSDADAMLDFNLGK